MNAPPRSRNKARVEERRLGLGLAVALVGHLLVGAIVAAGEVAPSRHLPWPPPNAEVEIAIESATPFPDSVPLAASAEGAARGEPRGHARLETGPPAVARRGDELPVADPLRAGEPIANASDGGAVDPKGAGSSGAAGSGGADGTEGWSFGPGPVDLGLGRPGGLGVVAAQQAASAPTPTKDVAGLREALDARDQELGLGRAGPLLRATEDAVREGAGPDGKATFLVSVDRNGLVDVTLENADKEADAWRRLIAAIKTNAEKGKPVRLPPNARALVAKIEIEAEIRWPDGRRVKDTQKPSGFYAEPPAVGSAGVKLPDVGFEANGKVCQMRGSLGTLSIGGGCSPENIGQVSTRVVHGRIVREQRL